MAASTRKTRVLVCEDSRTFATALARVLDHDAEIDVVGICETAEDAITVVRDVRPDLVTMDIELPGMSGLEAVEEIMSHRPVPILVLSSHVGRGSKAAAAALAAGALDALAKDDVDLRDPTSTAARAFCHRVKLLSGARVIRHPRARLNGAKRARREGAPTAQVIGVCASTGGPQALAAVIASLPASFALPILVVQHIASGFTDGLVRWLDSTAGVRVRLAENGAEATPGVWLAPEGAHLVLDDSSLFDLDML